MSSSAVKIEGYASGVMASINSSNQLAVITPSAITATGNPNNAGNYIIRVTERRATDLFPAIDPIKRQLVSADNGPSFYLGAGSYDPDVMSNSATAGYYTSVSTSDRERLNGAVNSVTSFRVLFPTSLRANTAYFLGLRHTVQTTNCLFFFFLGKCYVQFRCLSPSNAMQATLVEQDITAPTINVIHLFQIVVRAMAIEFLIDNVLQATLTAPTYFQSMGKLITDEVSARISTFVPADTRIFSIHHHWQDCSYPSWGYLSAISAREVMRFQNGESGAGGSPARMTNNMAITSPGALTNTATLGTGLGGHVSINPTLTADTDGIVLDYVKTANSTTVFSRPMLITGVWIDGVVTTALTGGPVLYAWSLCFGHTAVSLATTETGTAKAPRRIPLGYSTFAANAAIGTTSPRIYATFKTPLLVSPAERIQIVAKNVGTVTSAGVIVVIAGFTGSCD